MDDKSGYASESSEDESDQRPYSNRSSMFGKLFRFVVAAVTLFGVWMLFMPAPQHGVSRTVSTTTVGRTGLPNSRLPSHEEGSITGQEEKIILDAHIMSKCPNAQDCLRDLIVPAMEDIADKVNFTLSYIGEYVMSVNLGACYHEVLITITILRNTNEDGSIKCKHGISECMGNIIELCVASLYPDPKTSLGFTMCLTNDYKQIAEKAFVEGCALEHGIDLHKLDTCAKGDDGAHGMSLLQHSVARSADAGVITSCTVRLNNETWCVRDGGKWRDCKHGSTPQDLVREVIQVAGFEWQQHRRRSA